MSVSSVSFSSTLWVAVFGNVGNTTFSWANRRRPSTFTTKAGTILADANLWKCSQKAAFESCREGHHWLSSFELWCCVFSLTVFFFYYILEIDLAFFVPDNITFMLSGIYVVPAVTPWPNPSAKKTRHQQLGALTPTPADPRPVCINSATTIARRLTWGQLWRGEQPTRV